MVRFGAIPQRFGEWLARLQARRVLLLLGVLLVLPSIDNHLIRDDHLQALRRMHESPIPEVSHSLFDLYTFSRPGELNRHFVERGILQSWWSDPACLLRFFRPLAALTHDIDGWLWPTSPAMAHVQSIVWYAVLLAAVSRLYARLLAPAWLASVGLLLYVLDDTHGDNLSWIANRHAILATALGVGALLAHDRHRRGGGGTWSAAIGPMCFAVALLAGEIATAVLAYLFSYALFMDRASKRSRALSLAPYLVVATVWRVIYVRLGYGAFGSDAYLDPGREPMAFLRRFPSSFAVLLQGQLGFLPSDSWTWNASIAMYVVPCAVVFAGLIAVACYAVVRGGPEGRFWCASLLGALLPSTAALPADRSLLFSGVAAMAVVAHSFARVTERLAALPRRNAWSRPTAVIVGLLLLRRLVVAPLELPARAHALASVGALHDRADQAVSNIPDLDRKTLIVVNPPALELASYLALVRATHGEAVPARVRWFAAATSDLTLTRTSERSVRVRPAKGYLADWPDRVFRSARRPLKVGERVAISPMTATVTELRDDGNPAAADFAFDQPLESPDYVWMRWIGRNWELFILPAVGETTVLPRIDE